MAMNKALRSGRVEIMEIPAAAFTQMFFDVQLLAKMHQDLICMYEQESVLKKHHKAYLHIRDAADEMCRADKEAVALILDHYQNPKRYMDQANCFHNRMMEKYGEIFGKCDGEDKTPSEKCDLNAFFPSKKCEAGNANAVSAESEQKENQNEASEYQAKKQDTARRGSEQADMDVFDLPHGMVMMSTGTLGTMQDDMLALTFAVDQLVDAFCKIDEGGGYDRNQMNIITGAASELARDVFNRWDDADMAKLS